MVNNYGGTVEETPPTSVLIALVKNMRKTLLYVLTNNNLSNLM